MQKERYDLQLSFGEENTLFILNSYLDLIIYIFIKIQLLILKNITITTSYGVTQINNRFIYFCPPLTVEGRLRILF